jgi:3-oxoadipate enol-lactonase
MWIRGMVLSCLFCAVTLQVSPSPAAEGLVDVPSGKLFYQEAGSGEALVLIHDGLLPSASWDDQFAVFSRHYRVVRYDRRSYGKSETSVDDFSNVDDLRLLLDALAIPRAILVGCSSGGGLAADFALAYPERVSSLVLAGPVFSGFPYTEHFYARGARNSKAAYTGGDKAVAVAAWAGDRYLVDPGNAAAREKLRALLERYPAGAGGDSKNGKEPERKAASRLAEISAPTLLITGAADVPDVHAQIGAFAGAVPKVRRFLIEGAGHLAHLEKPEEWNRVVLDFLAPASWGKELLDGLRRLSAPDLDAFAYDARAPLAVEILRQEARRSALGKEHPVVDLTYAGGAGPVPAYLVLPSATMPPRAAPAVLFLHHGQGNRSTFLAEALELADHGVVSLSIDSPDNRPGYQRPPGLPWKAESERREIVQTIVDLRRGIDLLAGRPEVDPKIIGYVGYSLGSTMGARLIGVETRIRAAILIAGYPALTFALTDGHHRFDVFFRELLEPAEKDAYLAAIRPLDGVHFLGHQLGRHSEMAILLQFAKDDEFISEIDAAVYRAALPAAETTFYPGGHFEMNEGKPLEDRVAWLLGRLLP